MRDLAAKFVETRFGLFVIKRGNSQVAKMDYDENLFRCVICE